MIKDFKNTKYFHAKEATDRIVYFFVALFIIIATLSTMIYMINDAYAQKEEFRSELVRVMALSNDAPDYMHYDHGGLVFDDMEIE